MRVHPAASPGSHKKLRRLPHIFSRVLELPLGSDADVAVQERSDCFRFVVAKSEGVKGMKAHTVELHPGVTKTVVLPNGHPGLCSALREWDLDKWRFRLPESTRPELARAVCEGREFVVTVPKGAEAEAFEAKNNRCIICP